MTIKEKLAYAAQQWAIVQKIAPMKAAPNSVTSAQRIITTLKIAGQPKDILEKKRD